MKKLIRFAFVVLLFVVPCVPSSCRISLEPAVDLSTVRKDGWNAVDKSSDTLIGDNHDIMITVALKQRNLDIVETKLLQVSDPNSMGYGQYWTLDELRTVIKPEAETIEKVKEWLISSGAVSVKELPNGDFIKALIPIDAAERMLQTKFQIFRHKTQGMDVIRALEYTVPCEIAKLIHLIAGILRFPKSPKLQVSSPLLGSTTPSFIKKVYNIDITPKDPTNLQAIASFLNQYIDPKDLAHFRSDFALPEQEVEDYIGPNDPTVPGVEASLDIEYLMGIASGIRTWVWSTNGTHDGQEPFLNWLVDVSNTEPIPYIFSISYQDYEPTLSVPYMKVVSVEFMKLGTRGITLVTGSGDWGTGCSVDCKRFQPDFPSSSPFIVSTGATLFNPSNHEEEEEGTSWSSGGFSDVFPSPHYQHEAVRDFLKQNITSTSFFNVSGRAFPDVSTVGTDFIIIVNGTIMSVAGTSAATPTFASILSLINDLRLQNDLPTLGHVNPFLYAAYRANSTSFKDITVGNNKYGCCAQGFSCVRGWDPVTGLGTPRADILANLALSPDIFPSFARSE